MKEKMSKKNCERKKTRKRFKKEFNTGREKTKKTK